MASQPLLSRKRDLLYLIFFLTHIPVMFFVDLHPLWPSALRPLFMDDLRHWYIATYADRNFSAPTAWFSAYMWLEALYHVPLSFWAVGALARDDLLVPVHLLVFALETALTTLTCVAEYLSWADFTPEQKWNLGGLYVPYLALSVFMGVDMFARIAARLHRLAVVETERKRA